MALSADEAAAMTGPDTIDCIAPAVSWEAHWTGAAAAKRAGAGWLARSVAAAGTAPLPTSPVEAG
jgi:hypothetical protein